MADTAQDFRGFITRTIDRADHFLFGTQLGCKQAFASQAAKAEFHLTIGAIFSAAFILISLIAIPLGCLSGGLVRAHPYIFGIAAVLSWRVAERVSKHKQLVFVGLGVSVFLTAVCMSQVAYKSTLGAFLTHFSMAAFGLSLAAVGALEYLAADMAQYANYLGVAVFSLLTLICSVVLFKNEGFLSALLDLVVYLAWFFYSWRCFVQVISRDVKASSDPANLCRAVIIFFSQGIESSLKVADSFVSFIAKQECAVTKQVESMTSKSS